MSIGPQKGPATVGQIEAQRKHAMWALRDMVGANVDLDNAPPECLDDIWTLAQAFLAEHPADDDEPVTREWLAAIGFHPQNSGWMRITRDGYFTLESDGEVIWCGSSKLCECPTRGHVRRLCKALGIKLSNG